MFIPHFNTPDNYKKTWQQLKEANGYCLNCNKPVNAAHIYCSSCNNNKLFVDGLEKTRVRIGDVGQDTINYQQYLHRSIFGCNVLAKYRGEVKDRIKAKVKQETLRLSTMRLKRVLSATSFDWLGKNYKTEPYKVNIYNQIKHVRNIDKRLVYNILLYYISYHLNNNSQFKTFIHFQTSMMQNIFINIENTHYRVNKPELKLEDRNKRKYYINKYWYWLFKEIDAIAQPLMKDIIDVIY